MNTNTTHAGYAAAWQSAVVVPTLAAFGVRGLCSTGIDGMQTTDPKAGNTGSHTWSPPIT